MLVKSLLIKIILKAATDKKNASNAMLLKIIKLRGLQKVMKVRKEKKLETLTQYSDLQRIKRLSMIRSKESVSIAEQQMQTETIRTD